MTKELFTIGHSNHSVDEFIRLLKHHSITALADVRSIPYSSFNPQFNLERLAKELKRVGIVYVYLGKELGARRVERDCYINGQAKFSLISKLPVFQRGLKRIIDGMEKFHLALMCSEKDPLYCHRAILVCRNLRNEEFSIRHIHEDGELESHKDVEKRLMDLLDIQPSLFDGKVNMDHLLEKAYNIQGERIAFKEGEET